MSMLKKNQAYIYAGNKSFTSNEMFHTVITPLISVNLHTHISKPKPVVTLLSSKHSLQRQ